MINAIIVDDEKNSREVINQILIDCFPNINVAAQCSNVREAVKDIKNLKPDLLFLDIDLPDGSGFDILKNIDYKNIKIIFITAHHEYAIKAIKFSAFDYILKPVNSGELIETVQRVIDETELEDGNVRVKAMLENFNASSKELKNLALKTANKIYLVNIDEIIRCESQNNYTVFYIEDGTKIMVSKTIKTYESMLAGHQFIRVHQSHLINLKHVRAFHKPEGGMLVMSDDTSIPVSKNKRAILMQYFSSLS